MVAVLHGDLPAMNVILIIVIYIVSGLLLAFIEHDKPTAAAWIAMFWPLFIAVCVVLAIHEIFKIFFEKIGETKNGNSKH
jgi:TRAP-type C4-dicarboxylate transport system permease large subunit